MSRIIQDHRGEQLQIIHDNLTRWSARPQPLGFLEELIGVVEAGKVWTANQHGLLWRSVPFVDDPMMDPDQDTFWEAFKPLFKKAVLTSRSGGKRHSVEVAGLLVFVTREFDRLTPEQKLIFTDPRIPGRATGNGYDAHRAWTLWKERQFKEPAAITVTMVTLQRRAIWAFLADRYGWEPFDEELSPVDTLFDGLNRRTA